jgi:hypothetical protein
MLIPRYRAACNNARAVCHPSAPHPSILHATRRLRSEPRFAVPGSGGSPIGAVSW